MTLEPSMLQYTKSTDMHSIVFDSGRKYFIDGADWLNPIDGTYQAKRYICDEQCVIKKVQKTERTLAMLEAEKEIIGDTKELYNSHVIYAYDIMQDADSIYVASPKYSQCSLTSFIAGGEIKTERLAIEYFRQICSGLKTIHSRSIVHRELCTDNVYVRRSTDVLYDLPYELAIVEFGIAKELTGPISQPSAVTLAPESLNGKFTESSDIYSMGCIFYKMLTGKEPFTEKKTDVLIIDKKKFKLGNILVNNSPISEMSKKILNGCLNFDSNKRMKSTELFTLLKVDSLHKASISAKLEIERIKNLTQKVIALNKEAIGKVNAKLQSLSNQKLINQCESIQQNGNMMLASIENLTKTMANITANNNTFAERITQMQTSCAAYISQTNDMIKANESLKFNTFNPNMSFSIEENKLELSAAKSLTIQRKFSEVQIPFSSNTNLTHPKCHMNRHSIAEGMIWKACTVYPTVKYPKYITLDNGCLHSYELIERQRIPLSDIYEMHYNTRNNFFWISTNYEKYKGMDLTLPNEFAFNYWKNKLEEAGVRLIRDN